MNADTARVLMHASESLESVRPLSADERRADWASRYFLHGWHRMPQKPRIRIPVTVPQPREPSRAAPASLPGAIPSPAAGVGGSRIHSSPCHCHDDAQRHYALIARDLMAAGREDELTNDMRQAYDYEFSTAPAHEPDPF